MTDTSWKEKLKKELVKCLASEKEIQKIIVFGSFLYSEEPHDMDIAVFQDSKESYLPLALKYRKNTNNLVHEIALDIIPLRIDVQDDPFLLEIKRGEIIYEREY